VASTKQPDPAAGQGRETLTAVVAGGRAADIFVTLPAQITSVPPQVLGTMPATTAATGAAEGSQPTAATSSGDATATRS